MRTLGTLLMLATLATLAATPAAATGVTAYQGLARAVDGDTLLYEEHHLLRNEDQRPRERLVLYRCPDGAAFARKTVRYGDSLQAPEFDLRDARFGYREGFELGSSFVQRSAQAALQRETLPAREDFVVDAGFDEFVRAHWGALQRGDAVRLDFLIPSRLAVYGFKLRRLRSESIDGEPATVFRLALAGVFGWFADAIDVAYRDHDRRLMRFDGLTNIRRDASENLVARIEFPPEREQAASDADWQAALREPLSACSLGG